ncbi:hypothetical protein Cba03nite_13820 [Catellatospora bangladeshensis]|uniref:Uncharacterized protein n=1 Tax=Catellatospora bangladeshensis TaxID=310355 RepID=A0A8J3JG30_9ACTN|nr:hypothetical protein Cba03nite_13820 [Catellatospora bangladeshensis]
MQNAGAAGAVCLDDRDVRVELRGDQRRLVSGGSATDDHNPAHGAILPYAASHAASDASAITLTLRADKDTEWSDTHGRILSKRSGRLSSSPCVITQRTARTWTLPACGHTVRTRPWSGPAGSKTGG